MNKEQKEALGAVQAQLEDLPLEQRWEVLETALDSSTSAPRRFDTVRQLFLAARELSMDIKELTKTMKPTPASPADKAMAYIQHGAQPPPYKESLEKVKAADQIFSITKKVGTVADDLLNTLMNELDNQREWAFGGHCVDSCWVDGEKLNIELDSGDILEMGIRYSTPGNKWVTKAEKLRALQMLCGELGMTVMGDQDAKPKWSVTAFTRPDDEEYEYVRYFHSMLRAYSDGVHQLKTFGGKVVLMDDSSETSYEAVDVDAWRRIFELQGLECRHQDFRECDDKCPGWFINMDTYEVNRCDNCERFDGDESAAEHVNFCVREYERSKAMGSDRERWKVSVALKGGAECPVINTFHRLSDAEECGRNALNQGAKAILLQDVRFKNEWAWAANETEWLDRITDAAQEAWNQDDIQFPRLLTEILMHGEIQHHNIPQDEHRFSLDMREMCESMSSNGCEITWEDITEIFNRAQDAWEDMK
jgi:hypothetical protein